MFTGIVEEVGSVRSVRTAGSAAALDIAAETVLEGCRIGDSIAVDGVCLTVTSLPAGGFSADVMHETLRRSSLARLRKGSRVNLERAMPADGRFGGHIVSGHIDATGTIRSIERDGNAIWYTVAAGRDVLRYIVEKGSVAIDGISLTVARVDESAFAVSTIPHTARLTTLGLRGVGDVVNLECDIVGKYVEKLLGDAVPHSGGITEQFLAENGF